MRPLIVEAVELGLLLKEVGGGWFGGLPLQGEVHALMAPVLLRAARLDAFDVDPQAQPSDRQLAEVEQRTGAGESNAIVSADGVGQAELLEYAFEHGEGIGFLGGRERLAGDQITAGEVGDRQRIYK